MRYAKGFKKNYFSLNAICALNAQIQRQTALVRVQELGCFSLKQESDDTPVESLMDESFITIESLLQEVDSFKRWIFITPLFSFIPSYPLLHVTFSTFFRRF